MTPNLTERVEQERRVKSETETFLKADNDVAFATKQLPEGPFVADTGPGILTTTLTQDVFFMSQNQEVPC